MQRMIYRAFEDSRCVRNQISPVIQLLKSLNITVRLDQAHE